MDLVLTDLLLNQILNHFALQQREFLFLIFSLALSLHFPSVILFQVYPRYGVILLVLL